MISMRGRPMGSVWEGRHIVLDRRVAVKLLHSELVDNPEQLARFLREGKAVARVDHPHVAAVYDVGQEGGRAWLVMEFLEGEDLGQLLDREQRLEPARVVDLLLPVLAAIHAAHGAGVVHRDLKPSNIFLARDPAGVVVPKVVDFGVAKIRSAGLADAPGGTALTAPNAAVGTVAYMPIEQLNGKGAVSPTCDQYALGVTLYHCLTGRMPYLGHNGTQIYVSILKGQFPRPTELISSISTALEEVVLRAMHRDPAQRFPSVYAFGAALVPFASPAGRARWATAFGVEASATARPRWSRARRAGIVLLVALLGVIAAWLLLGDG